MSRAPKESQSTPAEVRERDSPGSFNATGSKQQGWGATLLGRWNSSVMLQRVITWGGLLALWEVFARSVGPFFFPTLGSVFAGMIEIFTDDTLLIVAGSFRQMFVGFFLAVIVGVPLGLLIGSSRIAEWTLGLYVNALFVTSLTALLPFLILIFGIGLPFRAAVVFLFAVFYLIINPASGVRSISSGVNEMATAFQVGRLKRFFSITLPGSLPYIVAGLRLGLGQSVQAMIIAELWVLADTGGRLSALGLNRQLGEFFALTILIVIIGTMLTQSMMIIQQRLTPWASTAQVRFGAKP